MKKISFLLMSLVAVLSLTGCGSQKVTCTMDEGDQKQTLITTFKGNKATNLVAEMTMKVDADEVDTTYSYIQLSAGMLQGKSGLKVSTSKGSDSVSLKMEIDFAKLDDETKEEIGFDFDLENTNTDKDAFIESMTESGYTCK